MTTTTKHKVAVDDRRGAAGPSIVRECVVPLAKPHDCSARYSARATVFDNDHVIFAIEIDSGHIQIAAHLTLDDLDAISALCAASRAPVARVDVDGGLLRGEAPHTEGGEPAAKRVR